MSETTTEKREAFEQWAVVDCFGHQKLAGKVTETIIAGTGFIRVDVPREDGSFVTKLRSPKSIYGIDPCSEAVARAIAVRLYGIEPVMPADWQRQLPAAGSHDDDPDEGYSVDDEDEEAPAL